MPGPRDALVDGARKQDHPAALGSHANCSRPCAESCAAQVDIDDALEVRADLAAIRVEAEHLPAVDAGVGKQHIDAAPRTIELLATSAPASAKASAIASPIPLFP